MAEFLPPRQVLLMLAGFFSFLFLLNIMYDTFKYHMFVNVGIGPDMPREKAHGSAWFEAADGGWVKRHFRVDKPESLLNPRASTIKDLFDQLTKMNLKPKSIEIHMEGIIRIYRPDRKGPILVYR